MASACQTSICASFRSGVRVAGELVERKVDVQRHSVLHGGARGASHQIAALQLLIDKERTFGEDRAGDQVHLRLVVEQRRGIAEFVDPADRGQPQASPCSGMQRFSPRKDTSHCCVVIVHCVVLPKKKIDRCLSGHTIQNKGERFVKATKML